MAHQPISSHGALIQFAMPVLVRLSKDLVRKAHLGGNRRSKVVGSNPDLSGERRDVERGVALLGGGVNPGAAAQQLLHDTHVALLGCQVQRIQAVLGKK